MIIDVSVGKSDYTQTDASKVCIARMVMSFSFIRKVRRSIQLNGKICASAIEINNISIKLLLPAKPARMRFQKIIPEMVFLLCCLSSQFLRFRLQTGIAAYLQHEKASVECTLLQHSTPVPQKPSPERGRWQPERADG